MLFCLIFSNHQAKSQDRQKTFKSIYSVILISQYGSKPVSIALYDSTVNNYIIKTNYNEIANGYNAEVPPTDIDISKMNASWVKTLRKADKLKNKLDRSKIPDFDLENISIDHISSKSSSLQNGGTRIRFSSVLLFKCRAIVEFSHASGILHGSGSLFFLQKKKGKWLIVSQMETWIS